MKKILVVDDDPGICNAISRYFNRRSAYQVQTARDGELALDQIKNDTPDIVILDLLLPGIDGLTVLLFLSMIKVAKDIPVIIISGKIFGERFKRVCLALGALDYIDKPFAMSALLESVELVLWVTAVGKFRDDNFNRLKNSFAEREEK